MKGLPNEVTGMKCPACGSPRVYPSRLRTAVERLRHAVTGPIRIDVTPAAIGGGVS